MKRKGTLLDFWSKRHKPDASIELFASQIDDNISENNHPPSINLFQSPMFAANRGHSMGSDVGYQDSDDLFPCMELDKSPSPRIQDSQVSNSDLPSVGENEQENFSLYMSHRKFFRIFRRENSNYFC